MRETNQRWFAFFYWLTKWIMTFRAWEKIFLLTQNCFCLVVTKKLQVLLEFFLGKIVILSGTFLTFMKFKELINSAKIFHVRTKITSLIQQIPTSFLNKLIGRFRILLRHFLTHQFFTPHQCLNQLAKVVLSKVLVC